jgi:hypothetical protein
MSRHGKSLFAAWGTRAGIATVIAFGLAGTAHAQRESGIQLTPDSGRYLINKDVPPNQRWAITWNLDDKTITGNVFFTDGSQDPQFLWCEQIAEQPAANPADSQFTFRCFGAGPCSQAPCESSAFVQIAEVPLPGSFLYPPGTLSTLSGNVQPIFTSTCATNLACHVENGAGPVNLSAGQAWANIFEVTSTQDPAKFYVDPFDPGVSYLFNKVEGTGIGSRMPLNMDPLTQEQLDAIRNWIVEGGANN